VAEFGLHLVDEFSVLGDLAIDFFLMVVVIDEGGVERCQIEVREVFVEFGDAPAVDAGVGDQLANSEAGTGDAGDALVVDFDVVANGEHEEFLDRSIHSF